MSTEPGNTANTSGTGRGAADGAPLRDRTERPAADDAARTVPADGHREPAGRVTGTDSASASAADPAQGSGRHTGGHVADPAGGQTATGTDARVAPAAETGPAGSTATRAVPTTETRTPETHTRETRTAQTPTAHTPTADTEDTRTRVAPVTASRDLDDTTRSRHASADRDLTDRNTADDRHHHGSAEHNGVVREAALPNREALLAREKERFGGMKFGSAFFGWLTATGMVVLLSALAAAIGAAVGLSAETNLGAALESAAANQSAGIIGAVIMLAVLLLSYYAGGYVAGRMARFNGLKQGLAVWLWALIAAAVVIVLGLIYGNDIRSISQLNSVAPLPADLENVSIGTWVAVAASLVVTLIGAILGGLAGMRFHRRIDRADFRTEETLTR